MENEKMIFWATRDDDGTMDAHFVEPHKNHHPDDDVCDVWFSDKTSQSMPIAWNDIFTGRNRILIKKPRKAELVEVKEEDVKDIVTLKKGNVIRFVQRSKMAKIEYYDNFLNRGFVLADYAMGKGGWFGIADDVMKTGKTRYFEVKVIND